MLQQPSVLDFSTIYYIELICQQKTPPIETD